MDSFEKRLKEFRTGRDSSMNKNSIADLFEEQYDYINEHLSRGVPEYNIMYVDPSLGASPENHLFKTYSDAKKYILDNLPAASETNKYLIKLSAGEIDDVIAGDSITGEEGCIHLDNNIILDCNDATVVTCPLKSNGNASDLAVEGLDYLMGFYVNGGVFTSIEGNDSLFAFFNSMLSGFDADLSGIYLDNCIINSGDILNTVFFIASNTTFNEDPIITIHKDSVKSNFNFCSGSFYLMNPTDTSSYASLNFNNCNIDLFKDADYTYYYDFMIKNSDISFSNSFTNTIYGTFTVESSYIYFHDNINFVNFVYDYTGTIIGGGDINFQQTAHCFNLEIASGKVRNSASKDLFVRNYLEAKNFSLLGVLHYPNKTKGSPLQVIADGTSYNVIPSFSELGVSNTSTSAMDIVIPDYLKSNWFEILIIDMDDASINNIRIYDEDSVLWHTILTTGGYARIYYSRLTDKFIVV